MHMSDEDLRRKREELVAEHMESENRHEFDATLATFDHPRYELIGTGDVYDGPDQVARYFEETRAAFPDQRNELIAMHHSDDAVIVEANLYGTHDGPFRGLPPTGRKFEMRLCAIFVFDEDRLVCERGRSGISDAAGEDDSEQDGERAAWGAAVGKQHDGGDHQQEQRIPDDGSQPQHDRATRQRRAGV